MSNKYSTNCAAIMDKIDLNSNELALADHQHIKVCFNCYSYYKIDQKIMSQLKQCCAAEIPSTLKNRLIEKIEHYDSDQISNNRFGHHQISLKDNILHDNSGFMTELMTCVACIMLVLSSLTLFILNMTPVLAETVIEHLEHRHISKVGEKLPANRMRKLLSPYDVNIDNMISKVIYADECIIDGLKSVHVIYSMNMQPVSIIAMPVTTSLKELGPITDKGYEGMIFDVENGTVVIASKDKTAASDMYKKLKGSLTAI